MQVLTPLKSLSGNCKDCLRALPHISSRLPPPLRSSLRLPPQFTLHKCGTHSRDPWQHASHSNAMQYHKTSRTAQIRPQDLAETQHHGALKEDTADCTKDANEGLQTKVSMHNYSYTHFGGLKSPASPSIVASSPPSRLVTFMAYYTRLCPCTSHTASLNRI